MLTRINEYTVRRKPKTDMTFHAYDLYRGHASSGPWEEPQEVIVLKGNTATIETKTTQSTVWWTKGEVVIAIALRGGRPFSLT